MGKIVKIILLAIVVAAIAIASLYFFEGKKEELNIKSNGTYNTEHITEGESSQPENKNIGQEDTTASEDIIKEEKKNNTASDSNSETEGKEIQDEKTESVKVSSSAINQLVSWGYQKSNSRTIDTIIIHSSYDAISGDVYSLSGIIAEYKGISVSPHYIIDRKGNVYRLVEDKNIAYHAGVSKVPDGRTNVNDFSIGIEIMNTKTDKPTDAQYNALKSLIANLKSKYKIKYVLGHDDIAPGRKDDPWNFDWGKIK